ncbi:MAG: ABC transporter permease [Myxococcota bacterium]
MRRFLARALALRLGLLVVVSMIAFAVVHLAPGEPSQVDPMNPRMKPQDVARIRAAFHLDEPLYAQYGYWLRDLATGELRSFRDGQPVLERIFEGFRNSVPLFLLEILIIWTFAFPVGIRAALTRGSLYDRSATFVAYFLISVPGYVVAYLAIVWVVSAFQIPVIGMRTFGLDQAGGLQPFMDRIWHLAIPALMAALGGIAVLSRYVRSQMLEVAAQDYVRTARAKGLPEERVVYHHALRNALLPFVTLFGFLIPGLIGGSVIIEQLFAWPGLGRLGYDAILARDFPMILTLNFFAAVLTLAGTLISDVLYAVVDPRIRLE